MSLKERVFGMTLKSVFRRKIRSGLTILGIAIGIMLVTALLMVANGLQAQFQRVVDDAGGDFAVMEKESADLMLSRVDLSTRSEIEHMDGVAWASGMIFTTAKIGGRPYVMVFGVEQNEQTGKHFKVIKGRGLNPGDTGKALIGKMVSLQEKLDTGDTVTVKGTTFEIVGIYETGASFEDGGLVIPLEEAQSIFEFKNQVSMLNVKVRNAKDVGTVRAAVESRFPQLLALASSEVAARQEDLQLITGISALISLIAILVGSIGIMNTMIMSVMERTREIGILRAIGWKKRKVLSMVLKESLTLSVIGGIIGIVLASGMVNVVAKGVQLPVDLPVTPDLVIAAFFIAVILGILGGFYPAWRASRMSPVEALSHE